jgi:phospholipid/cholesterol/gamma-HCH transport system ATP-binding protein
MDELTLTGIVKGFDGGPAVLDGLTATVPLDGITFVVGKSGSGKSVLCRLAVGLLKPDAGEVRLLGERVDLMPERGLALLRKRAPYLVQGPALLDWLDLHDNVALAAKGSKEDGRAMAALESLGLAALATRHPPEVSPGIRKRTAIARALVLEPRYLLLDEPTTGLDSKAAGLVNEALEVLRARKLGALVVSHDYAALERLADRVLEVDQGRAGYFGDRAGFLSRRERVSRSDG